MASYPDVSDNRSALSGDSLETLRRRNRRRMFWMIFFLVTLAPMGVIGVSMKLAPSTPQDAHAAASVIWLGVFCGDLPALYLLVRLVALGRRIGRLERFAALAQTSPRLPMTTVAEEFRMTAHGARELVLDAVATGAVAGRLELEQGLFLSAMADQRVREIAMHCPSCAANVKVTVAPGESASCPYCNAPLEGHALTGS